MKFRQDGVLCGKNRGIFKSNIADKEETLLSIVISDALVVVMRPDKQDYEGTGITVTVARELKVPNLMLVVNKAPLIKEKAKLQS